ncbi:MAG: sigma-54 dependent transcriptional regulator [Burkholderiales bacterium]
MSRGAVLVIEDEETFGRNVATYLQRAGYECVHAPDAERGLAQLETFRPDVVILDYNLPGIDGLATLERIRAVDRRVRVIMVTGHGNVRVAVDAMKASAFDYLAKPVALADLKAVVERAMGEDRRDEAIAHANRRGRPPGLAAIVGESTPIRELKATIARIAAAEATMTGVPPPILVTGETGAGKELVAHAIHDEGARSGKPFIDVNCGSIPANLLESELFGYERGAFTDARERKIGLVEAADGGTLFLDEIGDMDLALQVKLLRVLEEQVIRRLGSVRDRQVDVRVVSATHRSLEELVAQGRFRADLLFRLRIVELHVPPLRDRGEDILIIARHLLQRLAPRYGRAVPTLTRDAERAMLAHAWPGNVRELRNVLEQAILLAPSQTIGPESLRLASPSSRPAAAAPATSPAPGGTLGDVERAMLAEALERTQWNVSRAAQRLGVSRDTLRYRIAKYGMRRPGGGEPDET